jgi:TDG/mug DNA glycosylase family protein
MKCVGFDAVADKKARVLILGTLPGAKSLELRQYYAKPSNRFWRIMEELIGTLPADYHGRLRKLTHAGIALWDVCYSAERAGSLDSKIIMSTVVTNDFASFLRMHPDIGLICFNGRTAEKIFKRKVGAGISDIRYELLPSSSAAHAITNEQKLTRWRQAISSALRRSPHHG